MQSNRRNTYYFLIKCTTLAFFPPSDAHVTFFCSTFFEPLRFVGSCTGLWAVSGILYFWVTFCTGAICDVCTGGGGWYGGIMAFQAIIHHPPLRRNEFLPLGGIHSSVRRASVCPEGAYRCPYSMRACPEGACTHAYSMHAPLRGACMHTYVGAWGAPGAPKSWIIRGL